MREQHCCVVQWVVPIDACFGLPAVQCLGSQHNLLPSGPHSVGQCHFAKHCWPHPQLLHQQPDGPEPLHGPGLYSLLPPGKPPVDIIPALTPLHSLCFRSGVKGLTPVYLQSLFNCNPILTTSEQSCTVSLAYEHYIGVTILAGSP